MSANTKILAAAPPAVMAGARALFAAHERRAAKRHMRAYAPMTEDDFDTLDDASKIEVVKIALSIDEVVARNGREGDRAACALARTHQGQVNDRNVDYWQARVTEYLKGADAYVPTR